MSEELGEFKVSNDILDDPIKIRERMNDDGYLFFKALQDQDQLHSLRKDMMNVISNGGWLQAGFDPIEGVADISKRCTEGDPQYPDR